MQGSASANRQAAARIATLFAPLTSILKAPTNNQMNPLWERSWAEATTTVEQ
jgi:hypothetical protein